MVTAHEIRRAARAEQVDQLIARGFDLTTVPSKRTDFIRPRCSQCEVAVINGEACHETGCPNQMHECAECSTLVRRRERLCESCANPEVDGYCDECGADGTDGHAADCSRD